MSSFGRDAEPTNVQVRRSCRTKPQRLPKTTEFSFSLAEALDFGRTSLFGITDRNSERPLDKDPQALRLFDVATLVQRHRQRHEAAPGPVRGIECD